MKMKSLLPADYHMHTHHSGDSNTPMTDMIEAAISRNLKEICITEHMDMDFPVLDDVPEDTFALDVSSYYKELKKCQEKYKDKITLKYGVELGLQPQIKKMNHDFIMENSFDFVIGSVHLVDKKDPYYPELWKNSDEDKVIRRYFEITIECLTDYMDYDVLGHLDYIVRYSDTKWQGYSYEKYKTLIDEILRIVIKNGKGLDINSQSLFRGSPCPNPCPEILRRYKELGGEIITFGSDAHKTESIAGCFEQTRKLALDAGFEHYYTFTNRIPKRNSL